jgi:hypothetical protein
MWTARIADITSSWNAVETQLTPQSHGTQPQSIKPHKPKAPSPIDPSSPEDLLDHLHLSCQLLLLLQLLV